MKDLRVANGASTLGRIVVQNISKELETLGIKHYPNTLPQDQHRWALIYKQADEAWELVKAIFEPSADSNKVLQKDLGAKDGETIQKIRELVNNKQR